MIKRIFKLFLLTLLLALFAGTIIYLYINSGKKPKIYKTDSPFKTNIIQKTVATGSIQPRKEVNLKSSVSGVVDKIYVVAGSFVHVGQLIARIRIIPNMADLNNAETNLNKSRISLEDAEREQKRYENLFRNDLISETEYQGYLLAYNKAKEDFLSAENNLQIVKEGAMKHTSNSSNLIRSTVNGMLLDVPVREGSFVIESNTFNEGTTISTVADMNDMLFKGMVDESEVGKIKEGMILDLTIGAIENKTFKAKLEFISPKGVTEEGAIKFEIKAALNLQKDEFIRAGYSANADIIFDRKDSVLAIKESLLQFSGDSVYVEIETKPAIFEKRLIKTGISDGINTEILSGVKMGEKIKVAQVTGDIPVSISKK
ncbi:MAG TPA: efflux RND transporter periplasmic adaptor subunit [Cytophagaceae bacterium]|jgi:HlyD family secretion protein|nr:efflux RND transporter periplasmic adaptor subunit [Cytophagaceae bacterium]